MKTAREIERDGNLDKFKEFTSGLVSSGAERRRGEESQVRVAFSKRALDIGCLLVALPTLLPLLLAIAVLIKIVSPGPVFFRQERIGFLGKRFRIFKFRTMKVNAEIGSHQNHLKDLINSNTPMTKMDQKGDPRLIKFGRFLRSSGLDELPQLINVFRGEMSLVGPRPCTQYEYDEFEPWHKQRFRALPGLSGLWQVSGKNNTTFNEMINLDIRYANEWSLWLDIKIMFLTFPVLLGQLKELKKSQTKR